MGPSFQKVLPRWKVSLKLHTANIKKFERMHIQIKDAAHMPESHSRNGGCTTTAVPQSWSHIILILHRYSLPSPPSLLLPECSLRPSPGKIQSSQIKIDFYFTPLHRLIGGQFSRSFVWVWWVFL